MLKNNFLILSIIVFVLIFSFAFKVNGNQTNEFCLKRIYELYKKNFMSRDGRIIDYDRKGITTSEGQSYMLLRSLAVNDKKTFDIVWSWTKNNLQRPDKLFSWLWGENSDRKYTILDDNSASDADIDIASALILAYEKWGEPEHLEEAKSIINSIWNKETKKVGNYIALMPGAKQASDEKIEINPSYFSPYSFKLFQKYDNLHDWNCLIDSSYYYLDNVTFKTRSQLPPDWFLIEDGNIVLEDSEKSDFSYDAIRVFARIYIDYVQTGERRALPIIERSIIFVDQWKKSKTFYTNYKANGELRDKNKFIGSMALLIPVINLYDKKTAAQIYQQMVEEYLQNESYWRNKNDYYGKNLLWFGLYMYEDNLKGCEPKDKKDKLN